MHTSANLFVHFSNKNGKRTYYLSLSYLHILKYGKKNYKKRKWSEKSIIFSFFLLKWNYGKLGDRYPIFPFFPFFEHNGKNGAVYFSCVRFLKSSLPLCDGIELLVFSVTPFKIDQNKQ